MAKDESFACLIVSPPGVVYEGRAQSLIHPGENGVFEVLAFHKRLLSRLIAGSLFVDGHALKIRRGVARVGLESTVVLVEEADKNEAAA